MDNKGKIVCFGELLLRLNAPGYERLLQTLAFDVHICGAEANVASALAQFGAPTAMVSATPKNALGEAAIRMLKSYGVDTDACHRREGRMGLYFMSAGAVLRPSEIVYDRSGSVFAEIAAGEYDWASILDGASWLHVSGITPALSRSAADATLKAVSIASENGVQVSFDGNYRAQLWQRWSGDARSILKEILAHASLAFIDHRDLSLILSETFSGAEEAIAEASRDLAFSTFPKLNYLASTTRLQTSVNDHSLSVTIASRENVYRSPVVEMPNVVDRIGGGDAFAAGVIFALWNGGDLNRAGDFGLAASLLKHSIAGDVLIANLDDVERQMLKEKLDVRR